MLVVDTSAVLTALLGAPPDSPLVERLAAADGLEAPHLLDVEFLNALRRLVRRGELSADRASDARADLTELSLTRYPHEPLADRIWDMRENLTAYDASFVALAEALSCPLVTCDEVLTTAPGVTARIELFAP